jgi:hypothetical protein
LAAIGGLQQEDLAVAPKRDQRTVGFRPPHEPPRPEHQVSTAESEAEGSVEHDSVPFALHLTFSPAVNRLPQCLKLYQQVHGLAITPLKIPVWPGPQEWIGAETRIARARQLEGRESLC